MNDRGSVENQEENDDLLMTYQISHIAKFQQAAATKMSSEALRVRVV